MWSWLKSLLGLGRSDTLMSRASGPERASVPREWVPRPARSAAEVDPFELLGYSSEVPPPSMVTDPRVGDIATVLADNFHASPPPAAALPSQAMTVLNLVQDPEVRTRPLEQAIARDPALSARVMRVANSAFYGRLEDAETLRDAITVVGLRGLKEICTAAAGESLFGAIPGARDPGIRAEWETLYHHALTVSLTASWLTLERTTGQPAKAMIAGLLHDIGKVVALSGLAGLADDHRAAIESTPGLLDLVVEAIHVQLGADLAVAWKLPDHIRQTCARHHDADPPGIDAAPELHAIRVVSGLNALRLKPSTQRHVIDELRASATALGLDERGLAAAVAELRAVVTRVSDMLGIADPAPPIVSAEAALAATASGSYS